MHCSKVCQYIQCNFFHIFRRSAAGYISRNPPDFRTSGITFETPPPGSYPNEPVPPGTWDVGTFDEPRPPAGGFYYGADDIRRLYEPKRRRPEREEEDEDDEYDGRRGRWAH